MMRTLISKTCMEIAPAWISVAILKVLRIWLCVLFILICMFGQIIDIIRQQCFLCNIYSINFRKEINAQRKQREISLADRILPTQRASASIDHPDLSTRSTFRNMDFHCELSPSHQKKHRPWEVYDNCATHIDLQYGHEDNSMRGMFFFKRVSNPFLHHKHINPRFQFVSISFNIFLMRAFEVVPEFTRA